MFFEYNLPKGMPSYIDAKHRTAFNHMLSCVSSRMDLLEEALMLSGMRGEDFSLALERVFNPEDETPSIDSMTPDSIATLAEMLASGMKPADDRVEWPNAEAVVDTAFVTRKEWETLRMMGMGGSDAAVVLGMSPYTSKQKLYYSKCGTDFAMQEPDAGMQYIFEYGHRMEDMVIGQFCRATGCKRVRETRMFRSKKFPFITANIDAIVQFDDGRLAIFEAKTTTLYNRDAWADHSCPAHYVPQCRQYPAVLDDDRIEAVYIGCIYGNTPNDFTYGIVKRNKEAEEDQMLEEDYFWNEYVLAGQEPPRSGDPEKDMEIVLAKIGLADPSTRRKAVPLDQKLADPLSEYRTVHEERQDLESKVKALKKQEDALLIPVIEALGTNIKGEVVDGSGRVYTVSYAPVSRAKVDMEKLEAAFPDAYSACVDKPEESYRTFRMSVRDPL